MLIGGLALGTWGIFRKLRRRFSFRGKIVLISGGSRGLGLVIARQLAEEGARIALLARDAEELERAKQDLKERGADVLIVACDLAERGQILSAVEAVLAHFGGVDVLINNAGIIEVGPLANITREDFERSLAVHFWAAHELTTRLLPELKKRSDVRIVNISSIGGKVAVPHLASYVVGKFALTGFSDATRAELAADNIRVTTVTPGMMRTGSHLNARFKGNHSAEFAWFAISNGLPLISMSAERAAAKIIAACRAGQSSLTLTLAARLAIIANAVAPNLVGGAMKIASRFLPGRSGSGGNQLRTGWQSREEWLTPLTRHLEKATERNNET